MAQTHSHPHPVRKFRCYTRAIKNARYLQQHDPATFAKDKNAQGFGTGVPLDVLQVLHRLKPDAPELIGHAEVSNFLRKHAMPGPRGVEAAFPLFSGRSGTGAIPKCATRAA